MSGPLFGIVPTGSLLITEPASTPSPTSFLYELPRGKSFSHIVVFSLPNINLPENTAAAIYLATAQSVAAAARSGETPNFKFLGAIGPGKESAMFKVSFTANSDSDSSTTGLVIGVSVEPADEVGQKMEQLSSQRATNSSTNKTPPTTLLAQRIIQNAFNFLAGFSGSTGPGGVEVVPLRAFEDWWRKFESRVRADPSFLEKPSD